MEIQCELLRQADEARIVECSMDSALNTKIDLKRLFAVCSSQVVGEVLMRINSLDAQVVDLIGPLSSSLVQFIRANRKALPWDNLTFRLLANIETADALTLEALSVLCFERNIVEIEHVERLRSVLNSSIEDSLICQNLALFINSVTFRQDELKLQLIHRNQLSILTTILCKHLTQNKLVYTVLQTLVSFVQLKEAHSIVIDLDVIHILQLWSQQQVDHPDTYKLILLLITALRKYQQIFQRDLVQLLLNTLKINKLNPSIVKVTLQLIQCSVNIQAFCQFDGFGTLLIIQELYTFDPEITGIVLQTLTLVIETDMDKIDLLMSHRVNQQLISIIKQLQKLPNKQIFLQLMQLVTILSCDSIKCQIIWSSDFLELSLHYITYSEFFLDPSIARVYVHILNIYSQLSEPAGIISQNSDAILKIIAAHCNNYEISDDAINMVCNLIYNDVSNIDRFMSYSIVILANFSGNYQIAKKILDIYDSTIKRDHSKRVLLQSCLPLLESLQGQYPYIYPYIQLLTQVQESSMVTIMQLLTKDDREYLTKGVVCKLFKENGAYSELLVFMTSDLASIQCKHQSDRFTKPKWRLALKNISSIVDYTNDHERFKQSAFRQGGLLTKKPDSERCFTIHGTNTVNNAVVDAQFNVYAPSLLDKNRMFEYLRILIQKN